MSKVFPALLFMVSVLIAGTAAFFSVKGIGLLFAGSFLPVVVMASSLEIGKLFAVSLLYRKWRTMPIMLRLYLSVAITMLIAITSLGIFGFLSDAYQDTKNKVSYYETQIITLQSNNNMIDNQIKTSRVDKQSTQQQTNTNTDRYKQIYDDFIAQQNITKQQLIQRLSTLDQQRQALQQKSGGLFSNKKKQLEQLEQQQQSEREQIDQQLNAIEQQNKQEYDKFMNKVDQVITVDTKPRVDLDRLNQQIDQNNQKILQLKNDIHNTDIGSFKFIAESVGVSVDTAVKWFILAIVLVFDPLAMCLIIGYNVYVSDNNRYKHYESTGVIPDAGSMHVAPRVVYRATEYSKSHNKH